ncbi:MAG: HAMP domain-containing sensor histidine kinase, partial [Thermoanaerobaculia bacterium]
MKGSRSAIAALMSLAVLTAALIILGTLQYRWIGDLANAERERMRTGLEFAAHHFSDDFDHELTRMFLAFQLPMPDATADHLLHRYDEWSAAARDPKIVRAVYFVPPFDPDHLQLIDPATRSVRPAAWPVSLAALRPMIAEEAAGGRPMPGPIVPGVMALIIPCGGMRRAMIEHHVAVMGMQPPMPMHMKMPEGGCPGYTIVEIDDRYLARVFLPEMARRYFDTPSGREYDVAIVSPESGATLFRSDADTAPFRADIVLPIFSVRAMRRMPMEVPILTEPPPHRPLWNLLVRHHGGSMEDVVAHTRRRNLLLTGGILAVLAGTVLALVTMLRTAERLRLQQLEFVAGVTHELNTPVAALTSAGQNLADGIITEPSQVSRYGTAIVKESRRLTEMIGQVLAYGGMESRRKLPHVPVEVTNVIDEAIANCRWMADEQSIAIETDVDGALPLVDGDAASLARAVQNLIANAIRHGAAGKWVAIRAAVENRNVAISVEDRGPGIAARDLPHLFEPFYRGRGADRVRGSGLGLTIVKQIAVAHGGSVSVDKRRDGGATFTLRLPVRPESTPNV